MILKLGTNGAEERVECSDGETWEKCRSVVGGYLEPVYCETSGHITMLVDEDGYSKRLPVNMVASRIYSVLFHVEHFILGNVVFAWNAGDRFVGLPPHCADELEKMLKPLATQMAGIKPPAEIPEPMAKVIPFDTVESLLDFLLKRGKA